MLKIVIISLLLWYTLCCGCLTTPISGQASDDASPIRITDQANNTILFSTPASRIVTTSTYATEYLVVLGADDLIIGVNSNIKENPLFTGHLKNAQIIGSRGAPDIEKIISLNPDVVLLPVETTDTVKNKLRISGLKAVYFDFYSLDALPDMVRTLGEMTGREKQANEYLRFFDAHFQTLISRIRTINETNRCRVYYEMSSDYSTSGKGSGGYNYLKKLRANNTADALSVSYPIVSAEWLMQENPDVIIKLCDQAAPGKTLKETYDALKLRPEFMNITAGEGNRTYVISTNVLYGPRVIVGLALLGKAMYPEMFPDIDPTLLLNDYSSRFFRNANLTEMIYPGIGPCENC